MPDAAAFQRAFAQTILAVRPSRDMPPAFAVYRNTWLQGLLDALGSNYPTVAMIVGDDIFKAVALEFARAHPPATPVLAMYGAEFPDFLASHELGHKIPYLRDVAMLERLWTECLFASDASVLEQQDCADLTPAQLLELRPGLHPATRVARFETPAVTIWRAHRTAGDFEDIAPEWTAEHALITRRGAAISVTLVDEATHAMLAAIGSGRSLGFAISGAVESHPRADLSKSLATVISISALTTRPAEDMK